MPQRLTNAAIGGRLALGTAQFGMDYGLANSTGQIGELEAASILSFAYRHGVRVLDTAMAYGNAEEVLGRIGVTQFQVVSKLRPLPDNCANVSDWVERQVVDSLRRLGVDRLEALLLHAPDQLLGEAGEALASAMHAMRTASLANKIGVSIYHIDKLQAYEARMPIQLVQFPANLIDGRVGAGILAPIAARGIELHARSAFLQGLLLMGDALPAQFDRWRGAFARVHAWIVSQGITPLEACLRHTLSLPGVSCTVVGIDSQAQIAEILAVANQRLEMPGELQLTDAAILDPSRWGDL